MSGVLYAMSQIPAELVERYLAGDATPDERGVMHAWLASHASHVEVLDALRVAVEDVAADALTGLSGEDATWQRIRARSLESSARGAAGPSPTISHHVSRVRTRREIARLRVGAPGVQTLRWLVGVVVAVVALAVVFWPRQTRMPSASRTYTTQAGQRATVVLADGSRAILAPQSTLVVLSGFGTRERRVQLTGEAYFIVSHVAMTPFLVQTGHIMTRVVGTVFDVRHYRRDPDVRVAVVSGRVAAGAVARPAVTLVAGTVGRFTDSTATAVMSDDVAQELAWVQGRLVFRDTPLPEALARLGQWYGIELRLSDTVMAHRHVTGVFDGESQAEALVTLQSVLDVTMTFDNAPGRTPVVTLVRRDARHAPVHSQRSRARWDFSHSAMEVGR